MKKPIKNSNSNINRNNELLEKMYELEQRLSLLEHDLDVNSSKHVKDAVRVTGALELPKVIKVNSSESQLVDIYNEYPHFLGNLAIKVSLTAESYRQPNQNEIFFEKDNNGNYLVIATENDIYWLLPKINIKINRVTMRILKLLFDFQVYQESNTSEFILVKPARVSLGYHQQQWKLEEPGELEFGEIPPSSQLQSELRMIKEGREELRFRLEQATQKIEELSSQIEQIKTRLVMLENKEGNFLKNIRNLFNY